MIGYKAFNADMTCRGFQYEVEKSYEMDGKIELCERGYHFCENIADCFSYYGKDDTRFAKIEAYGEVIKSDEDSKCVTNKIRIIEEIPRDEAVRMSNSGDWNSGNCNFGDCNTGDWNTVNGSSGCFNTEEHTIMMFNKPSNWTLIDWWDSAARRYLIEMRSAVNEVDCTQAWWDRLNDYEKIVIMSLPNFDAKVFKECTGIDVYKKGERHED